MPENFKFLPNKDILSYEEMFRLIKILHPHGINKIRITGGEPFVRRDLIDFLTDVKKSFPKLSIHITTNGALIDPFVDQLLKLEITNINLSLDTLDKLRFLEITKRDELNRVFDNYHLMINSGFNIKINAVIMSGINDTDIIPLATLAEKNPVDVRFIEEMPFNGGSHEVKFQWDYKQIIQKIRSNWPKIISVKSPENSTSQLFKVPGFRGRIGVIPAYSRIFCGNCNRIRIDVRGNLKTCLYGKNEINLKKLLNEKVSDAIILNTIQNAIHAKPEDGFVAEKQNNSVFESMTMIGG